jgi:hypothetical protein
MNLPYIYNDLTIKSDKTMNLILIKRAVSCKLQFIQIQNSLLRRAKCVKSEAIRIYNK